MERLVRADLRECKRLSHPKLDVICFMIAIISTKFALTLRKEGKITTPGEPFQQADDKEIENLLATGVFKFDDYDINKHGDHGIFNARMVQEIKGKASSSPYEKSRLMIQGYSDNDKKLILTQSPTIQRSSQRVILSLFPSIKKKKLSLRTRDITQAYI
ncbi:hypothetical protein K3495_g13539 [Podosphaera aphanis]|nr:hypothetical protein K3495_g13539 [Podosphaera aphanis]